MSKVRVHAYSISIDGYGAGPDQTLKTPLGVGGQLLHSWMVKTETFHKMIGKDGGSTGLEDEITKRGFENVGAWILGRNMYSASRGPWTNDGWKGWWGDNPPYHCDTFILTHYAHEPIEMEGGTTFHFVTDGIHAALERAKASANGKDIRIGGGAETIRQYLKAGLIDEMHFAISPVLLGSGEHLLNNIDLPALGYECTDCVPTSEAMHIYISKK